MIEVRIATATDPLADRCWACGDRWGEPDPVQLLVFEDGEFTGFHMCGTCRFLPEDELRAVMRAHAEQLIEAVVSIRLAADGEIRRPTADSLVLEHWFRQSQEGE